jgi:hypothetical protein
MAYDMPAKRYSPGGYVWMISIYLGRREPYHLVWNIEREETSLCDNREIKHLKPNMG